MSKSSKDRMRMSDGLVEIKSKFDAEFRRFSVNNTKHQKFEEFEKLLINLHRLQDIPFLVCYTDPKDGDLLPINNDDNYNKALTTARPLMRLMVQRKGESYNEVNGYGTIGRPKKNPITKFIASEKPRGSNLQIGMPNDFRRVSAIIDVDIVPETHRRVKLMKNGSDKPLGFYIRDGTSVRVTPHGLEKVPGIFISRLVPGGLAESTGLLAVNDEVLEVNGIEVAGKTLDQVTDMMVANSSNLIVTVKPVNQRNNLGMSKSGTNSVRQSQKSVTSEQSAGSFYSGNSANSDEVTDLLEDDEDEIEQHIENEEEPLEGASAPAKDSSPPSLPEQASTPEAPTETPEPAQDKDSAVVTL